MLLPGQIEHLSNGRRKEFHIGTSSLELIIVSAIYIYI